MNDRPVRLLAAIALAAGALALASCSKPEVARCSVDADCPIGVCSAGVCRSRAFEACQGAQTFGGMLPSVVVPGGVIGDVAVSDVDHDGRVDIVTANVTTSRVHGVDVALGRGDGTFDPPTLFELTADPTAIDVAPFGWASVPCILAATSSGLLLLDGNGDGTFDAPSVVSSTVFASTLASGKLTTWGTSAAAAAGTQVVVYVDPYRDSTTGLWTATTTLTTSGAPLALAIADATGDGKADLVVVTETPALVVYPGDGQGGLGSAVTYTLPTGSAPTGLAVGDVTGDGKPDAVVAYGTQALSVLAGTTGGLSAPTTVSAIDLTLRLAVADMDGAGGVDLVAQTENGPLVLRWNAGDGTFEQNEYVLHKYYATTAGIAAADLDGDGHRDVVVTDGVGATVLRGNGDGTLAAPATLSSAVDRALTTGDLDGDGKPDVFGAGGVGTYDLYLFRNAGSGAFTTTVQAVGSGPYWAAPADLNGDGHLDLAVANHYTSDVSVLLNDGTGALTLDENWPVGGQPRTVVAVDMDGDDDLDLVVGASGGDTESVTVLLNDGAAGFADGARYPAGSVYSATAADVDGDGDPDVIASSTQVEILLNDGNGGLGTATTVSPGFDPNFVAAADVDRDHDVDLVAAGYDSSGSNLGSGYLVLLNDGAGTFTAGEGEFGVGSYTVTIADVDGDGYLDVVTPGLDLSLGNGDGTFRPAVRYPCDGEYQDVADFTGDGRPDVVCGGWGEWVTILDNGCRP